MWNVGFDRQATGTSESKQPTETRRLNGLEKHRPDSPTSQELPALIPESSRNRSQKRLRCARTTTDTSSAHHRPLVHALPIPFQNSYPTVICFRSQKVRPRVPERFFWETSQKVVSERPRKLVPDRKLIQRNLRALRASLLNRRQDLCPPAPEERCVEKCSVLQLCCWSSQVYVRPGITLKQPQR